MKIVKLAIMIMTIYSIFSMPSKNNTNHTEIKTKNIYTFDKMIKVLEHHFEMPSHHKENLNHSLSSYKKMLKNSIILRFEPSKDYSEYLVNFKLFIYESETVMSNIDTKILLIRQIYLEIIKDKLHTLNEKFLIMIDKVKKLLIHNDHITRLVVKDLLKYKNIVKDLTISNDEKHWQHVDIKKIEKRLEMIKLELQSKSLILNKFTYN